MGEEVWYTFVDGIINPAPGTGEYSLEDLMLILVCHRERKVALADRAAEDV